MTVAEMRKTLDEYDGGCPLAVHGQVLYVGEDGQWREVGPLPDPEDCWPETADEL